MIITLTNNMVHNHRMAEMSPTWENENAAAKLNQPTN